MNTPNEYADFWRYDIGVNVIPATNKHEDPNFCKKPFWVDSNGYQNWITWKESGYQKHPITEKQHLEWKENNAFKDGIAVICGQVFHNDSKKGWWFNGIDCDNLLGLHEVCVETIEEVAKYTLVEQHSNKNKCHIGFYTKEPIQSKSPSSGDNIPQIEIKSGGAFLLFCAGGIHKDGSLIEILDCKEPQLVEKEQLENKLDKIFKKYNLIYLQNTKNSTIDQLTNLKNQGKNSNRQGTLLSLVCKFANGVDKNLLSEQDCINKAIEFNNQFAEPYREDIVIEKGKAAYDYCIHDENKKSEKKKDVINEIVNKIQTEKEFVTLTKTNEILTWDGKRYNNIVAETYIKSRTNEIYSNSTINIRNEVLDKIKVKTYKDIEMFDSEPEKLNIDNGVLDLTTITLSQHSPENLTTMVSPVEFHEPEFKINEKTIFSDIEKNLKDTLFWKFLKSSFTINEIFDQDSFETSLEVMASVLVKRQLDEKAIMNLGSGDNGKSVYLDYIENLVGEENTANTQLQQLAEDRFMSAELKGKMVNVFRDLESNELKKTGKIKTIISNEGIQAQKKHGHPFVLKPFCKLIFSSNRFPKVYDQTPGFFRRWIIIQWQRNFENDPERDNHLKSKLKSNRHERNKVFSCLVYLARFLNQSGTFSHSKDWKKIQKEWNSNADPISDFVENFTEESENDTPVREMHKFYKEIMYEKGESPLQIGQFGKAFSEYFEQNRDNRERKWCNVKPKLPVQVDLEEFEG